MKNVGLGLSKVLSQSPSRASVLMSNPNLALGNVASYPGVGHESSYSIDMNGQL